MYLRMTVESIVESCSEWAENESYRFERIMYIVHFSGNSSQVPHILEGSDTVVIAYSLPFHICFRSEREKHERDGQAREYDSPDSNMFSMSAECFFCTTGEWCRKTVDIGIGTYRWDDIQRADIERIEPDFLNWLQNGNRIHTDDPVLRENRKDIPCIFFLIIEILEALFLRFFQCENLFFGNIQYCSFSGLDVMENTGSIMRHYPELYPWKKLLSIDDSSCSWFFRKIYVVDDVGH